MQHSGHVEVGDMEPHFEGFGCVIKVLKSKTNYTSCLRNHIRSRRASAYEGHSIKLEQVVRLNSIGSDSELLTMAAEMPTEFHRMPLRMQAK